MKPSMQARGATDAAVAMGNVICYKVLCREDQKTNGPLKYQNVIFDTKTKDQFLPKVLRERIRSEAVGVFPGRGACLSESLSRSGRRPLRKATEGGPWDTVHGCSCLPCQLNVRHIFKRQFLVYWEKGTFHTPGFLPRTLFLSGELSGGRSFSLACLGGPLCSQFKADLSAKPIVVGGAPSSRER